MNVADIVLFATAAAVEDNYVVDAEKLLAGDGRQSVRNVYSDESDQFHAGVWRGEVATWRVRYTEHEFCHMLTGEVKITDVAGDSMIVRAGDSFVIPAGFVGVWQVLQAASKLYVIFESKR